MRYLFLLLAANLLSLSVFCTSPQDSIGVTKQEGRFYLKYLVGPGETIYRISTKYGIPISDLMETNPELENGLKTGQVLLIPYAPEKRPAPEVDDNQYHVVEKGETFFSISRKYNIPVGDLLKANNIELKTGQKIVIKKGPASASKPKEEADYSTNFNVDAAKTEPLKQASEKPQAKENKTPSTETSVTEKKTEEPAASSNYYDYTNSTKRILVIPFDPYLYFSDADDEIAAVSHISRTKVRQAFRRRLNAYLEPKGYETIHLLGGQVKDSTTDLNRIYSSISYTYDNVMMTGLRTEEQTRPQTGTGSGTLKKGTKNESSSPHPPSLESRASLAKDDGKYFAVKIKDPNFFPFFDGKYKPDYYIFVSQFEVKTNYENCLDRARQNYERNFVTHFSIFDKTGTQISGGRLKSNYESGTNSIEKILADNIPAIAERIMGELPK